MPDQALDPLRSPEGSTGEKGSPAPEQATGEAEPRPTGLVVPPPPSHPPAIGVPPAPVRPAALVTPPAPAAPAAPAASAAEQVGTVVARELPEPASYFVGRERELAQLRAEIGRPGLAAAGGKQPDRGRVLLVVGRPGAGRTELAVKLAREVAQAYPDGQFFVRLTDTDGSPVLAEDTARALLRALAAGARSAALPGQAAPGQAAPDRAGAASSAVADRADPVVSPDPEPVPRRAAPAGADAEASPAAGQPVPDRADTPAVPAPGRATAGPAVSGRADGAPAPRPEPAAADPVANLRAATAGRRLLFVLDDVTQADQLAGLLPESPGSLVVATADGPLSGVPDVRPCTLGGLDTPAALALLAGAIGGTRVTNDPRAAERLVQEVSGHPTALRLAAAWLAAQPRMPLSEASVHLHATPDTPLAPPLPLAPPPSPVTEGAADSAPAASGQPAADRRPAAPSELLRAFRAAYSTLPPAVARLLRSLVLAPAGSIDAHVASALAGCAVDAADRALADLADSALLVRDPADGLYRVPGCLGPLLGALLAATDRPQDITLARARMLERTVRLLDSCRVALARESGADGLPGTVRFASPAVAAAWLRVRRPALMAAARAAVADGELDTLARRLITSLVRALLALPGAGSGARPDGLPGATSPAGSGGGPRHQATRADRYELHTLSLAVAERRHLPRERAAALINLADLDAEAARTDRAVTAYRKALEAARAADDTGAEGRVLEAIGGCYLELGDLSRACDWFGRALALRQGRDELVDQARLHARIGAVLTYLGGYGPALREWRAAAGVHRRLGDLASQARALAEAARVQQYSGQAEDALRTCRDALYYARQVGERRFEAAVLLRLADALQHLGDTGGADLQRAAARRLLRAGESPAF